MHLAKCICPPPPIPDVYAVSSPVCMSGRPDYEWGGRSPGHLCRSLAVHPHPTGPVVRPLWRLRWAEGHVSTRPHQRSAQDSLRITRLGANCIFYQYFYVWVIAWKAKTVVTSIKPFVINNINFTTFQQSLRLSDVLIYTCIFLIKFVYCHVDLSVMSHCVG